MLRTEVKTDNNDIGDFKLFFLFFFRRCFFKKTFCIDNLFNNSFQDTNILDSDQDIWVSLLLQVYSQEFLEWNISQNR